MNTQVDCWKQHPPLLQSRGQLVPALPFVLLFPQKSCLCCGEVSPWLNSTRMVLGHKQPLVPWHTLALRLHTACQRWCKAIRWGCKGKATFSSLLVLHLMGWQPFLERTSGGSPHVTDFSVSDPFFHKVISHRTPGKNFWERYISC